MAQTMEDYRSRTTMAGYRRRKRLEQQIGLDTYSADLSRFAESVGDGGSAYLDEASFVGARQNAEALLGRTEALREYMRLYGGDATGLEETSKWLTGRRDYLGGFSDFSQYQAQRAQYERESQNYDFEGAANRLQGLRERLDAIPSGFKGTMQDVGTALSNFVNGFFANGEQRDLHADHRSALESEIAALENEMARARVYAVRDTAALPGFDWFSKAKTTNRKGIAFGADGSDGVDWQHEYINGDGDRSAGTWYFDQVASDPYRSIRLDSFQEMSEEELARYNYLYNTQGRDAAQQYLNGIYDTLYSRTVQRIARLSGKHPVLGTLLSLGGSTMGAVEELGSILTGTMGESNISTDFGEAAQSGVASNINSDFGAFLYNTGVSALQSAATGLLFGHAGGVVLGLSAMASTRNDLLRRGADAATATKAGLAAGVFEGLFETLSLGTLPALKEVPVNSLKDLVLNIAKSTGVNASEEMATEIANVLYDTFANGDFSAAQQMLDAGMSKAEVAKQLGMQIAEATASGAVMGLGFGVTN